MARKEFVVRTFYYIRHGETDWNADHRLQGRADIPLNEKGIEQAEKQIAALKTLGINKIVSSPLLRAKQTANIIASALGVDVVFEEKLTEIHLGSNEGKVVSCIVSDSNNFPDNYVFNTVFPFPLAKDGECFNLLMDRTKSGIFESLEKYDGTLLFVGHGGALLSLQQALNIGAVVSKNAIPYHFYQEESFWRMKEAT